MALEFLSASTPCTTPVKQPLATLILYLSRFLWGWNEWVFWENLKSHKSVWGMNASWPSWLWNFLFSWSNFTLPPHGLSTSLPIEDRKPKQIEAVANGSFQDLETPIPDTKTHFLLVNMMHDVSQAVPDEVIINLPSPTPMHHADHPSFLSMWSEKQYPGFSPHENWLGRLISSKEETHFPNSSSKPSLSPTNNHRVFSPSLFQRPQDHKPSQMARTKKLPISLAQ